MRIAIFGATSQIAKDLIQSFAKNNENELILFARRPEVVKQWLEIVGLKDRYVAADFSKFTQTDHFDAMLNFVGVGNPAQTVAMGAAIFDATYKYDELALNYVRQNNKCRYIFLSSGAVYGASFDKPVDQNSKAEVSVNNLKPQDWYAVAKLYAECRHRALPDLAIIDIRVFNYFSRSQDMSARFLISDILRSIRDETVLKTSSDYIVRDYINPEDFHQLVVQILSAPVVNSVVDCYSRSPVDKTSLLEALKDEFGLKYEIVQANVSVNATGNKPHYYSLNRHAADFGYQPKFDSLEGVLSEMKYFHPEV